MLFSSVQRERGIVVQFDATRGATKSSPNMRSKRRLTGATPRAPFSRAGNIAHLRSVVHGQLLKGMHSFVAGRPCSAGSLMTVSRAKCKHRAKAVTSSKAFDLTELPHHRQ